MSWLNLSTLSKKKPVGDSTRIAVEKWFVVIRPGRALAAQLGWKAQTKIGILSGRDEHAGLVRLAPSSGGWSLRSAGGGKQDGAVALRFARSLGGADVLPDLPQRLSTTAVEITIIDKTIVEFRLPWAPVTDTETAAARAPLYLPGKAGSPAPCALPAPGFVDTGARGITAAVRREFPVQDKSLPKAPPSAPAGAGNAFGRMSAAQTEEFVLAVARGAPQSELGLIIKKHPATYAQGSIKYLKEKLADRIKAAPVPAAAAPRLTDRDDPAPNPPSAPRDAGLKLPARRPDPSPAAAAVVMRTAEPAPRPAPAAAPVTDQPSPIASHILKFLREEVVPVLAPLGRRVIKTRDGTGLLLDGAPSTLAEVVAEANRIIATHDGDPIVIPAMAAE